MKLSLKGCDKRFQRFRPLLNQHCQLLKDTFLYWKEMLLKAGDLFVFSSYFLVISQTKTKTEPKWFPVACLCFSPSTSAREMFEI